MAAEEAVAGTVAGAAELVFICTNTVCPSGVVVWEFPWVLSITVPEGAAAGAGAGADALGALVFICTKTVCPSDVVAWEFWAFNVTVPDGAAAGAAGITGAGADAVTAAGAGTAGGVDATLAAGVAVAGIGFVASISAMALMKAARAAAWAGVSSARTAVKPAQKTIALTAANNLENDIQYQTITPIFNPMQQLLLMV